MKGNSWYSRGTGGSVNMYCRGVHAASAHQNATSGTNEN